MTQATDAVTETIEAPADAPDTSVSDMAAGFDDVPTETPEPKEEPAKEEPETPAPEFVQLTKGDFEKLMSVANEFSELKGKSQQQLDTAFGKIGGLQRALDQIAASTPQGVDVSDEDFAELIADYPELAKATIAGINRAVTKARTNPAANLDKIVEDRVNQRLDSVTNTTAEDLAKIKEQMSVETLDAVRADWRDQVKSEGFQKWLGQQPEDYRQKVNSTWSPSTLIGAISTFEKASKEATKAPEAKPQKSRLAAAVTPRGTGGHATETKTDDFTAGYEDG